MKVSLTVVAGPGKGRVVEFSEPRGFVIGRAEDADYKLPKDDGYVSRRHAYLEICPPSCRVRDLGSTNPIHVNSTPVEETDLKHGDILELGYTSFEVAITGVAAPLPAVKCLKCGRIIDVGAAEAAPDLCGPCEAALRSVRASAPPIAKGIATCMYCHVDLSDLANSDGRAAELSGIVDYCCPKCLERSDFDKEVRGNSIGPYALRRKLGEGGMGVVYLAYHSATGRLVAVKQIKGLKDEESRQRFERESRIARSLTHKNVVRCLDKGTDSDKPYIVTEFLPGGDVERLVQKEGGKLSMAQAVQITRQLLDAVDFVHRKEIVHRDIKPLNMLIRPMQPEPGVVKLTDFGLAKAYNKAGGITVLNQFMGTLMYSSPEQVSNTRDVRPPGDLYSIGVTLYYLLTGKYTFDFPTPREIAAVLNEKPDEFKSPKEALAWIMRVHRIQHPYNIILTDEPTLIRDRDASIPKGLAEVVDKAVRKDIGARFQSAAEFRTALDGAV